MQHNPYTIKSLCILGAAESGVGAAILASKMGYRVFVSDASAIKEKYKHELNLHHIPYEEGGNSLDKILGFDEVLKSPGIPHKSIVVQAVVKQGIPLISELELAYRHKGQSKIVAITGSNGKSTTTSLIYYICKQAELDCALVGNIGYSICKQMAEEPKLWYITEVSSFQLDDIIDFRPEIAVLLNITEDHLDRYDYNIQNYIHSKFNIIKNQRQDDVFICCIDDEIIQQNIHSLTINNQLFVYTMKQETKKGAYLKGDQMMLRIQEERVTMSIHDFALKGKHNIYNTMAASIATSVIGIRKEKIRDAVKEFSGLEHRMEHVATIRGVDYINDSKATNVNSTWFALESVNKPCVLILGGTDKGNDYAILEDLVKEKVKAIVCLGKDNKKIVDHFKHLVSKIVETKTAKDAVEQCAKLAAKGDIVLLSPACASFDLFQNYEDRGKQFKSAVNQL